MWRARSAIPCGSKGLFVFYSFMKRVRLSHEAKRLLQDLTRAWLLKHGELGAGFDADCIAMMRSAGVLSNSTEHLHSTTLAKQRTSGRHSAWATLHTQ